MKRFVTILWIDCECGHTGIFDGFIVRTGQDRCIGCYMCRREHPIHIPNVVFENQEMTWGYFYDEPLKVNLKICSEIQ